MGLLLLAISVVFALFSFGVAIVANYNNDLQRRNEHTCWGGVYCLIALASPIVF